MGASLLDLVRGAGREKQQALSVDDESDDMAATLRRFGSVSLIRPLVSFEIECWAGKVGSFYVRRNM